MTPQEKEQLILKTINVLRNSSTMTPKDTDNITFILGVGLGVLSRND